MVVIIFLLLYLLLYYILILDIRELITCYLDQIWPINQIGY